PRRGLPGAHLAAGTAAGSKGGRRMICFPTIESDTILVNLDALERAYAEAAATLQSQDSPPLLAWPPDDYAHFEARRNAQREGFARWLSPSQNQRPGTQALWTAWWTDALGRKHHRIVAESDRFGREEPTGQPPLALLYPEQVVRCTAR